MTGSEELYRIADKLAWIYPEEAHALMRVADEHRRMSEALDDLVKLSYRVLHAKEACTNGNR